MKLAETDGAMKKNEKSYISEKPKYIWEHGQYWKRCIIWVRKKEYVRCLENWLQIWKKQLAALFPTINKYTFHKY